MSAPTTLRRTVLTRIASALCVVFTASSSYAASPSISSLTPAGFQRGTTTTVNIAGDRLTDAEGLLFSDPGIVLEGFEGEKGAKALVANVRVAPEVALGLHYVRIRTATGVTSLRPFFVGQFPQTDEVEPNNGPGETQPIEIGGGITVEGTIASEDIDYYSFALEKGQVLNIEVEAWRLGYTLFDPVIALMKPDGTELASCDDSALLGQDPHLNFVAPEAGTYLFEIMDSAFAASNGRYRVHFGSFPRPTSVFPRGAQVGTETEFSFTLPDGSTSQQKFTLPAEPTDCHPLYFGAEGTPGAPSPNCIILSQHPHAVEEGENNSRQTGTKVPFPGIYSGTITEPSQDDYYTITLTKDTEVSVKVFGRRLRSPIDTVLYIYNSEGKTVASNDDISTGQLDSAANFKAEADGEYTIRVYDRLDRCGPDYNYCVSATVNGPALGVSFPMFRTNDSYTRQFIVIPRGGRYASRINVRRSKQGGDLQFGAPELPAGVSVVQPTIPDGHGSYPVIFQAAADAPLGGTLSHLQVQTGAEGGPLGSLNQGFQFMRGPPGNTVFYQLNVDEYPIVVCNEAPFEISLSHPPIPIVQKGRIPITVTATRKEGFGAAIKLYYLWNSPGVTGPQEITMKAEDNTATFNLDARGDARVGEWTVVIMGEAAVEGGGVVYNAAEPITFTVEEPFVDGKVPMNSVTKGGLVEVRVELDQRREFSGNATATLLGLPSNTTVEPIEFNKDATEIVFPVQTAENTPAGTHKSLMVRLQVPSPDGGDHTIVHNFAHGSILRVDNPRKPEPAEEPVAANQ